jgi:uncharacterized membrane protein
MITFKILRLLHLFCYLLVTCQVLFYLVVFSDALRMTPVENFLEHRKIVNLLIGERYRVIYYSCLATSIGMVIIAFRQPSNMITITAIIALVCLIADLVITIKGNMPLNDLIDTFIPGTDTARWDTLRTDWLNYFRYRGILSTIGMMSLLAGTVFEK